MVNMFNWECSTTLSEACDGECLLFLIMVSQKILHCMTSALANALKKPTPVKISAMNMKEFVITSGRKTSKKLRFVATKTALNVVEMTVANLLMLLEISLEQKIVVESESLRQ